MEFKGKTPRVPRDIEKWFKTGGKAMEVWNLIGVYLDLQVIQSCRPPSLLVVDPIGPRAECVSPDTDPKLWREMIRKTTGSDPT